MATTAPSPPRPRQQARLFHGSAHGNSFGGKLNGLQFRAGQQCSHPYGKTVLVARASSPPAVQGFDDMSADAGARRQVCDRALRCSLAMKQAGRGVPCSLACRTVSFEERQRVGSLQVCPQCGLITLKGSSSSTACCLFCAHFQTRPNPPLATSLKTSNIMQARTPLCLEYTGARDLMGRPVIEDGLARVSAPRSACKIVRGMKQQRPLQAVSGVNDLGPHDNALLYSVTVNTDCGMYWVSVWLTPALKDAHLVRWLVEELASRSRRCCCSIACSVGHRCIMGSRCVLFSVVCSLVRRVIAVCAY